MRVCSNPESDGFRYLAETRVSIFSVTSAWAATCPTTRETWGQGMKELRDSLTDNYFAIVHHGTRGCPRPVIIWQPLKANIRHHATICKTPCPMAFVERSDIEFVLARFWSVLI